MTWWFINVVIFLPLLLFSWAAFAALLREILPTAPALIVGLALAAGPSFRPCEPSIAAPIPRPEPSSFGVPFFGFWMCRFEFGMARSLW